MDNVITFLVVIVFLLIVYSYTTGKIEKRKNKKAEKKAGRLLPAGKGPEQPDEFLFSRVLIFPLSTPEESDPESARSREVRLENRINRTLREIADVDGHDVKIESFLYCDFVQDSFLLVIISCKRPHVKDEG